MEKGRVGLDYGFRRNDEQDSLSRRERVGVREIAAGIQLCKIYPLHNARLLEEPFDAPGQIPRLYTD